MIGKILKAGFTVYEWLSGKKTYTGAILHFIANGLDGTHPEIAQVVRSVSEALLVVGLADKGVRVAAVKAVKAMTDERDDLGALVLEAEEDRQLAKYSSTKVIHAVVDKATSK